MNGQTQGDATARQNYLVEADEIEAGKRNAGAQPLLAVDINTGGNGFSNLQRFIEHQPDGFNSINGAALAGDEGQIAGTFMPHYFMLKERLKRLAGFPSRVTVLPDGRIMRVYKLPEFGQRIKRVPFSALFGLEEDSVELLYGKVPQMTIESSRGGNVGGNITEHFNRVRRAQEMPDLEVQQNAIFRVVGQGVSGPVTIGLFKDFSYLGQVEINPTDDLADIGDAIEAVDGVGTVNVTDVKVSAKAEGAAELSSHPVNTGSVVAILANEGAGNTLTDASSKGINGAKTAAVTWEDDNYGSALDFALTGVLDFGNPAPVRLVAALTLYAKIKTTKAAVQHLWNKWGADGNKSYSMGLDATGHLTFSVSANGAAATTVTATTAPVIDGDWHDVAVTYDGAKVRLFVDGVKVKEQNVNVFLFNSPTDLFFGNYADGSDAAGNFVGQLDVARVWNRPLGEDHISVLAGDPYTGFLVEGETLKAEINTGIQIEFTTAGHARFEAERFEGGNYVVYQTQFGNDGEGLPMVPGPYLEPDHVLRYKAKTKADLDSIKMGITAAEGATGPDPLDPHIIKTSQAGNIGFDAMAAASWYEDREKNPASHVDGDMNITASITLPKDKQGRCEEIYATDNRDGGCGVTPWFYRQAFKCGPWEFWADLYCLRNQQPDFPTDSNISQRAFPVKRNFHPGGSCILTLIHPANMEMDA
jgi:hypothetical protein